MRILLSLKHENIIDIKDFLCENSIASLKDIYIIQVIIIDHHQLELSSANTRCTISYNFRAFWEEDFDQNRFLIRENPFIQQRIKSCWWDISLH